MVKEEIKYKVGDYLRDNHYPNTIIKIVAIIPENTFQYTAYRYDIKTNDGYRAIYLNKSNWKLLTEAEKAIYG